MWNKNWLLPIGLFFVALGVGMFFTKGSFFDAAPGQLADVSNALDAKNATSTAAKDCSFETSEKPNHTSVIINEIAWMGTAQDAKNEWIELKNTSSGIQALRGWHLVNQSEKIKIVFDGAVQISGKGFYLLGREKNIQVGVGADTIYKGTLKNDGDSLRLFDADCHLMDEVVTDSVWLAGDNTTKKTMERSLTLAWHTSTIVGGTPKKENTVIPKPKAEAATSESTTTQETSNLSPNLPVRSNIDHILISQVQTTGGTGQTENDFIELYNPTGEKFNLKGYRLVKRTQSGTKDTTIKSWTADAFIPAYGFYLWANSGYASSVSPDVTTSESISDNNGIAIRFGPNDKGAIIDSVAWGGATNAFSEATVFPKNPGANQSLLRKGWANGCVLSFFDVLVGNGCDIGVSASDFELTSSTHPRNSTSIR